MSIARQRLRVWKLAALALAALAVTGGNGLAQGQSVPENFNIVSLHITSVGVQNGQLVANGMVGRQSFTSPITLATRHTAAQFSCPVLDLQVGPIDQNLLGFHVETSPICLAVTAIEGGGRLGDLLCNVARLRQNGVPLGDILAGLTSPELTALLDGQADLLNLVLDLATSNNLLNQSRGLIQASCPVLNLSIGPIVLIQSGLVIELDDCAGGPVTVKITAIPGAGRLGHLLCSLTDLLNTGEAAPRAIQQSLWNITRVLEDLPD
jgi:hypothetical protein